MNKLIDTWYPNGWRWLGTLTVIALAATAAGYTSILFGLPILPAKMVLAVAGLLVLCSGAVIAFARDYYKTSIVCTVLALVWVMGQIIYWMPYWVA